MVAVRPAAPIPKGLALVAAAMSSAWLPARRWCPFFGGVGLGLLVFLGLGRLLTAQLFAMRATDPATLPVVGLALTAVGLAAALAPALRSVRVDRAVTLRCE